MSDKYINMEKRWDDLKKRINAFENADERIQIDNVEKNKWKSLMYALAIKDRVILYLLNSNWQETKEKVLLGERYAKIALEKKQIEVAPGVRVGQVHAKSIQYELLYFFNWLNSGKEDKKSLSQALKHIMQFADELWIKKVPNWKSACTEVVALAIKAGEFDIANKYLDTAFQRQRDQKLEREVIYDKKLFYNYILESLSLPMNLDIKNLIKDCYVHYFDELTKGNKRLFNEYKSINEQIEMAYIWFKYFSDYTWGSVSPYTVIQSIRYGKDINV
ncbi:hypothetical protein RBH29_16750 [Herbivorax sp. ANBcel31]|uniref:hypothetical protein n=1 Tax=Herbivorax sp. ANBcel31 TaxID=3069754 RepID=UPI0027B47C61|nr:hypothetical protein [Herbivorax sp. ANBcel31]MDQ2088078.1 hypothetical protein [Herbivorax sp. ANBcel31]